MDIEASKIVGKVINEIQMYKSACYINFTDGSRFEVEPEVGSYGSGASMNYGFCVGDGDIYVSNTKLTREAMERLSILREIYTDVSVPSDIRELLNIGQVIADQLKELEKENELRKLTIQKALSTWERMEDFDDSIAVIENMKKGLE